MFIHLVIYNIMMLLFGVGSYKVRPPRLVSYACLYTTDVILDSDWLAKFFGLEFDWLLSALVRRYCIKIGYSSAR